MLLTICGAVMGHVNTIKLETTANIKVPINSQFSLTCNQRISPILRTNVPDQSDKRRTDAQPFFDTQSQNAVNGTAMAIPIPNTTRNDLNKFWFCILISPFI